MSSILTKLWQSCLLTAAAAAAACGAPPEAPPPALDGAELAAALERSDPAELAASARRHGDATRGALLFYQQRLGCFACHEGQRGLAAWGPDLSRPPQPLAASQVVDALLRPSKDIRPDFRTIQLRLANGAVLRGLVVHRGADALTLRDINRPEQPVRVPLAEVEAERTDDVSLMPAGLAAQLKSRREFEDLVKYVLEISEQGPRRAAELRPPLLASAAAPLPEYEQRVDHAGLIADDSAESRQRGEEIYRRVCANCHGDHDKPGSLPTSLRFASGKFKRGADPFSMYQTLTHGFGQMVPQTWMVPQQKYDVIHYIREAYLRRDNASQHFEVTAPYLASLPPGDTRGPKPVKFEPWATMDYGNTLTATYEIGADGANFAHKGIAIRLDAGPGGVAQGRHWMVFDEDTLRWAAGWSGGFQDWNGILFNGQHGVHSRVAGDVLFANPTAPGWARPHSAEFDDPRIRGRDNRPYGPLPRAWGRFRGLHHYGGRAVVHYAVGDTDVLELPGVEFLETPAGAAQPETPPGGAATAMTRAIQIGERPDDLWLQVVRATPGGGVRRRWDKTDGQWHRGVLQLHQEEAASPPEPRVGDGESYAETPGAAFDLRRDFSVAARLRTSEGGAVFAKTSSGEKWVPGGRALFVRGGRVAFDIGWVGVVTSRRRVADGAWHDIVMTWRGADGLVELYIDGKLDNSGVLKSEHPADESQVVRLGFAAPNFPQPSRFRGELESVAFFPRRLSAERAAQLAAPDADAEAIRATAASRWQLKRPAALLRDLAGKRDARLVRASPAASAASGLVVGAVGPPGIDWHVDASGDVRLRVPAGPPARLTLRVAAAADQANSAAADLALRWMREPLVPPIDLTPLTRGAPPQWAVDLSAAAVEGDSSQPFATDVLTLPDANPWLCRVRPTGFDFFADGDRAAVCTWDGDVWVVSGIDEIAGGLRWRRIAAGLFQPLGLKIVDGQIYVSCRDQICILRDLNGDGETDYYECFNSDHQVTEHFHEFAMGLQTDAEGNFYYAKSARHALPAIVPHHGTLLRVTRDGRRTDILANGFRAANGVCLNADGTFIVTDQEGHWNPKNRINWVRRGGFYGNMFGYHDVTDSSDDAMQQPLCWITNEFDRSPAELLWVDSPRWGPLNGALLNLSYGYGRIYVVPHETVDGKIQGGMSPLPLSDAPTGLIRGRFHPQNGQLYACGMFAWAGSRQQPGGFYRIRYTGRPACVPLGLHATRQGMEIEFSAPVDPSAAQDPQRYQVQTWSLQRTANYGSKHYDQRPLKVSAARVSADGKTVSLEIPEIATTWCMEVKYRLRMADGEEFSGVIHNTIHALK